MKLSQVLLLVAGTCVAVVGAESVDLASHLSERYVLSDIKELEKRVSSPELSKPIDMKFNGKALDNSEATLTLNATAKGWINFSGGCTKGIACNSVGDVDASDNFTSLAPPSDLDDAWVGVAFDSLVLHVDFALVLHPTQPTHEISQTIGEIPFELDLKLAKATLTFKLQFHGWMNNTKPANFAYGFDVHVPDNSAIIFPLEDLSTTDSVGFSKSTVTPGNLTSSNPSPEFTFQYSLRPEISFTAETEIPSKSYNASLYADIPSVNLEVSQVQNVNAKCEPSPAGAPAADVFANLTHITPSVGFDLVLDNNSKVSVLANSTTPLPTSCLEFFPKTSQLAAPSKAQRDGGIVLRSMSGGWLFGLVLMIVGVV